ncbi:HAD-IC family P-type ATPase [Oceanobacillus halotolerans]|uniref:HAD-IC family P-type ATPase n=1 Tax=Oceanobacillus halotolerans TaxID=2663380 RepID=UPI00299F3311|nr:HAD-IC family P-type ATPase [Oceanobacillus halotolerans]
MKFIKQFHDVLIYVLIVAAIITLLLGHYIDTVVIGMVIIINATIGYIQENKAEKALDAIKNMLSPHANVIRDGERKEIDAADLVVGDILLLSPGDKVPADCRLITCHHLTAEESTLTGESISVEKSTKPIEEETVLGDQLNMVFSGTSISSGTGIGVVVAVGDQTELGKINQSLAAVDDHKTPLLEQTATFGRQLTIAILAIGLFIFVFAYFLRDYKLGELALSVIALIVAAIPEGLPAIMSIILAIGVQNMVKRKAIVRNLPSVETLGSVSVICSDKTGTLTKNEMTVRSVETTNDTYEVSGLGYSPEGKIQQHGKEIVIDEHPQLMKLLLCVRTANDSSLTKDNGQWVMNGEPTDGSLMTLAEKVSGQLPKLTITSKIPFDSEYKYMAVLTTFYGENYIFTKGAPDRII